MRASKIEDEVLALEVNESFATYYNGPRISQRRECDMGKRAKGQLGQEWGDYESKNEEMVLFKERKE